MKVAVKQRNHENKSDLIFLICLIHNTNNWLALYKIFAVLVIFNSNVMQCKKKY